MSIIKTIISGTDQRKLDRLSWIVAIEVALLMVIASFFLPGGDDLYRYYLPFSGGCMECGFIPYFASWILWPLAYFPFNFAWPIWTAISVAGLLGLCWSMKANPALVMLAFPAFGQVWLGQIDVLVCAGLALALMGSNAYFRGAGIALALIKPQFSILAILFLLTRERELAKVAVIPIAAAISSLLVFGVRWPLEWFANATDNVPVHVWRLASMDLWPYGLLLLWVPLLFTDRRARFEAGVLVSALSTPFVGVYSYIIFLVFLKLPWWSVLLSYSWLLMYPYWREESMRLAWILPLALLSYLVHERFNNRPKPHASEEAVPG